MDGCFCGAHARTWLGRGPYDRDRVSLVGGPPRTLRRDRGRTRILTFALGARLPTVFSTRDFVKAGALMSYGPNYSDLFRHSADYVDKILRGTKPGDIPVEQPTKFELVINLTTATALGLTIPESFLLRADEIIE